MFGDLREGEETAKIVGSGSRRRWRVYGTLATIHARKEREAMAFTRLLYPTSINTSRIADTCEVPA